MKDSEVSQNCIAGRYINILNQQTPELMSKKYANHPSLLSTVGDCSLRTPHVKRSFNLLEYGIIYMPTHWPNTPRAIMSAKDSRPISSFVEQTPLINGRCQTNKKLRRPSLVKTELGYPVTVGVHRSIKCSQNRACVGKPYFLLYSHNDQTVFKERTFRKVYKIHDWNEE